MLSYGKHYSATPFRVTSRRKFYPFFRTSQDRDRCDRLLKASRTIIQTETARIQDSHNLSAVDFWTPNRSHGRVAVDDHQAKVACGAEHDRLELTLDGVLLCEPFRAMSYMPSIIMAMLTVHSQMATLHGSIKVMVDHLRSPFMHPQPIRSFEARHVRCLRMDVPSCQGRWGIQSRFWSHHLPL